MGLRHLTRVDVSLDGWDIDTLILSVEDRLGEILESFRNYEANLYRPPLSEDAKQCGMRMCDEVWEMNWDLLCSLRDANRRLAEIIENR